MQLYIVSPKSSINILTTIAFMQQFHRNMAVWQALAEILSNLTRCN